jgi:hypothetical protein
MNILPNSVFPMASNIPYVMLLNPSRERHEKIKIDRLLYAYGGGSIFSRKVLIEAHCADDEDIKFFILVNSSEWDELSRCIGNKFKVVLIQESQFAIPSSDGMVFPYTIDTIGKPTAYDDELIPISEFSVF